MIDLATLAIRIQSQGADQATRDLQKLGDQAGTTESRTDRLALSTQGLIAKYGSLATILATAGAAFAFSIARARELETATANLAANTGLAGDGLLHVTQRAVELSDATTQSATAILYAAEQLEGLVPTLNGNADAIADVTTQAVLLAEATGLELPRAVESLGQVLAQFGGDADDAARYANVLVAAAQNGAAEVPDLTAAFERVGPAARRAGLSLEESAAAVEILANKGIRGREAVGGLTELFNKLAESGDARLHPAIVGLDGALEELARRNLTTAERTKLLGENAGRMAEELVAAGPAVAQLVAKITDTDAAAEQAAVQLDTLTGRATQLGNAINNLAGEFGGNFTPYLKEAATAGSLFVTMLRDTIDFGEDTTDVSKELGDVLRGVAFAFGGASQLAGGLVDTAIMLQRQFLNLGNILTGDFSEALDGAGKEWDDFTRRSNERLAELKAAYAAIDNPDALLQNAVGASKGDGLKSEINAWAEVGEKERAAAAARREIAAAELAERQKFTEQYVEYVRNFGDETYEVLAKANQEQLELQINSDLAKWEAKLEHEERVRENDEDRQKLLAERMVEWFQTDLERTLEFYDEREAAINEYFKNQTLPNEEERARRLAQVHEQREKAVDSIVRRGAITRDEWEKLSAKQKTQVVLSSAQEMTAGLAQHSKAAFQLNKTAGIAGALIDTYASVAKALKEGGPFAGPLLAAAMLAKGMAQVQAIRGTQFEGGGSGTTPSLAGSVGTVNSNPVQPNTPAPAPQGAAQGAGSETRIYIVGAGATMNDRDVVDLLGRVKGLVDDQDYTMFQGNSRQALDVVRGL